MFWMQASQRSLLDGLYEMRCRFYTVDARAKRDRLSRERTEVASNVHVVLRLSCAWQQDSSQHLCCVVFWLEASRLQSGPSST